MAQNYEKLKLFFFLLFSYIKKKKIEILNKNKINKMKSYWTIFSKEEENIIELPYLDKYEPIINMLPVDFYIEEEEEIPSKNKKEDSDKESNLDLVLESNESDLDSGKEADSNEEADLDSNAIVIYKEMRRINEIIFGKEADSDEEVDSDEEADLDSGEEALNESTDLESNESDLESDKEYISNLNNLEDDDDWITIDESYINKHGKKDYGLFYVFSVYIVLLLLLYHLVILSECNIITPV